MDTATPTLVYFGHHKCASTYVNQVLVELCAVLGYRIRIDYLPRILPLEYHTQEPHASRLERLYEEVVTESYDVLCHGNADKPLLEALQKRGSFKGFHVIRDPRDIVVSGYFSHRNSHPASRDYNPWLLDHRERSFKIWSKKKDCLLKSNFARLTLIV